MLARSRQLQDGMYLYERRMMIDMNDMLRVFVEKMASEIDKKNPAPLDAALLKVGWLCYKAGVSDGSYLCSCKQVGTITIPEETQ